MPEQNTTLNSSSIKEPEVNAIQKPDTLIKKSNNNKKIIILIIAIVVLLPICAAVGYTGWTFLQLGRAAIGQAGNFPILTGDNTLPTGFPKTIPLTSDAILMMKADDSNKTTGKVLINISYQTKQSTKDIQDLYDSALFDEGWYEDQPNDKSGNITYLYYKKGSEKLMVIINASSALSLVNLTYQK